MDAQTADHLVNWLTKTVASDERMRVLGKMIDLLKDYPELTESRSWPEIRQLAERN